MRAVLLGPALAIALALPAAQAQQEAPPPQPDLAPSAATGMAPDAAPGGAAGGAAAPGIASDAAVPEVLRRVQEGSELRSDWLRGTTVATPDGETIGTIDDLLIDGGSGTVTAAILSVGGFLGIGAKSIAVNWDDLQMQYDGSEVTLAMSREQADAAPAFEFRDQEQPPPTAPAGASGGVGGGMGAADAPPPSGR